MTDTTCPYCNPRAKRNAWDDFKFNIDLALRGAALIALLHLMGGIAYFWLALLGVRFM